MRLGHTDGTRPRTGHRAHERRTAGSRSGSACIRTARASRRRWPRSRTRFSHRYRQRARHSRRHRADALLDRTWGSRSMVMAGGAVGTALRGDRRAARNASAQKLLQLIRLGFAARRARVRPSSSIALSEIAHTWYPAAAGSAARRRSCRAGIDQRLQARGADSGTFSYAVHAVTVAVDPDLGDVELLELRHRRGRRRAGQSDDRRRSDLWRARARHRHRALRGNAVRQRGAARSPRRWRITCFPGRPKCRSLASITWKRPRPTRSSASRGSAKAARIAPPAAIANAVNDALRPLGVELLHSPIVPRRIVAAVLAAGSTERPAA